MVKLRIRSSVVCIEKDHILAVALEDPSTKVTHWYLPGGKIENEETPEMAALRETMEETGYRVELVSGKKYKARYPFVWNNTQYDVTTHFFLAKLKNKDLPVKVNDAPYHRGVNWIPLSQFKECFGWHDEIFSCIKIVLGL